MNRRGIVSGPAQKDYQSIEDDPLGRYSKQATREYLKLVDAAITAIFADPFHVLSRPKDRLRAGLRSFHVRHARKHARASHVLFYYVTADTVTVIRILHQAMNPTKHLNGGP